MMLFAVAANVAAQEQTPFKSDFETGGFDGPVVKFASVNDQGPVMVGGRGGWIINHSLVLGGGGYGVASKVDASAGSDNSDFFWRYIRSQELPKFVISEHLPSGRQVSRNLIMSKQPGRALQPGNDLT